jgi:hypothetical protein
MLSLVGHERKSHPEGCIFLLQGQSACSIGYESLIQHLSRACSLNYQIVLLFSRRFPQEAYLTMLQTAVNAKLAALLREFEALREQTAMVSWCKNCWWDNEALQFEDWILVDAWYRSRCLGKLISIPNPLLLYEN